MNRTKLSLALMGLVALSLPALLSRGSAEASASLTNQDLSVESLDDFSINEVFHFEQEWLNATSASYVWNGPRAVLLELQSGSILNSGRSQRLDLRLRGRRWIGLASGIPYRLSVPTLIDPGDLIEITAIDPALGVPNHIALSFAGIRVDRPLGAPSSALKLSEIKSLPLTRGFTEVVSIGTILPGAGFQRVGAAWAGTASLIVRFAPQFTAGNSVFSLWLNGVKVRSSQYWSDFNPPLLIRPGDFLEIAGGGLTMPEDFEVSGYRLSPGEY